VIPPLSRHDRDELHTIAWHHRQRPGRWVVARAFDGATVPGRARAYLLRHGFIEKRMVGDVVMLRITAAGLEALAVKPGSTPAVTPCQ
jgi:hypothetical protein